MRGRCNKRSLQKDPRNRRLDDKESFEPAGLSLDKCRGEAIVTRASAFATRRRDKKQTRLPPVDMMKIRFAVIAACTGTFALVQSELAQAAYPGFDVSKWVEASAEVGMEADNYARDPVYHPSKISFRTEVRKFDFPYGIILDQTSSRNSKRNYHHSQSYPVDVRNRHSCHNSAGICTPWNKVHPRRHRHHP